jgi:hypothetical protein
MLGKFLRFFEKAREGFKCGFVTSPTSGAILEK